MNLLSSLLSGFAGAANGTAQIYVRGASMRATWYPDLEASSSNSSGTDIALDAYGSALVYVNQLVDVVVKDSSGNTVRAYGDGYSAPNVEVISPAFTGIDYVTAASGVSKPTTLQAVLDKWETNAGSPDWKVDIGGADTTLLNAFGSLSGLLFNVKSPAYGAVGDGVTNDQSAIAAALAAAVSAGGGTVFFPAGTYLISTAIEWAPLVNIIGSGPGVSIIKTSSAVNARILTFTTGSSHTTPLLIAGVGFDASVTNTGEQVYASAGIAVLIDFYRVAFGASASCVGNLLRVASGGRVTLSACDFSANGSGFAAYLACDSSFKSCRFVTTNTSRDVAFCRLDSSGVYGRHRLESCLFDISAVTSAPTALYGAETVSTTVYLSCVGCHFDGVAQSFTAALSLIGGTGTIALVEANAFVKCSARYVVTSTLGNGSHLELKGSVRATGSGTAYTVDGEASVWELSSSGTAPIITIPDGLYAGQPKTMVLNNTNAGSWSPAGYSGSVSKATALAATAVPAAAVVASQWVWSDTASAGTYVWMKIAEV